jgi:hypothetical protein
MPEPWKSQQMRLDRVADLVVPFRRGVYRAVAVSFSGLARARTHKSAVVGGARFGAHNGL